MELGFLNCLLLCHRAVIFLIFLVFHLDWLSGYDNAAGKQGAYLPYINNAVLESGSYVRIFPYL